MNYPNFVNKHQERSSSNGIDSYPAIVLVHLSGMPLHTHDEAYRHDFVSGRLKHIQHIKI